ncbi:MAG: pyridoxamine 5'-phosphate oxidase family protein [Tissierellia bacterium]|nr:pyridoxamine 5'-phosphate oxidase family protein [Tissierellia bacterium]
MRRKDREVTQVSEIKKILDKCKVFRIGMVDESGVYILPLNFGYSFKEDKLELYFHGAKVGKKVDLLTEDLKIGFEMDCEHQLIEDQDPCEYSFKFASIIGQGRVSSISEDLEKIKALNFIMKQQTGREFKFSQKMLENVLVYKIVVEKYSAKRLV